MKQAYVVCGPESSGNRLLTSILIRSGCVGEASDQPGLWHQKKPSNEEKIVLTISFPHGHEWIDLVDILTQLNNRGYAVWFLITVRDHHCVIESQKQSRLKAPELAWGNYMRAYREIFKQLAFMDVPILMVPYEAIISRSVEYVRELLTTLNLPYVDGEVIVNGKVTAITDGNAKYYLA